MTDNATVVREDLRNTGGDKYETTAREIQICRFSTFCSKWRMTFRKVTPAALKVNVKKFWQVLLVPWHVWAPIWVHFAPWWSIFPVKNRFSHIFPVPGGLPFLTVILTVKLARLGLEGVGKWHQLYLWRLVPSVERWSFSQPPKSPLREGEDIALKDTTYPLWCLDSDSSRTKLDCLDGIFHLKFTISRQIKLWHHHHLEEATLRGEGVRAAIVLRPTDQYLRIAVMDQFLNSDGFTC